MYVDWYWLPLGLADDKKHKHNNMTDHKSLIIIIDTNQHKVFFDKKQTN